MEELVYRHPRPDAAWLAGTVEPILEPDLPIVDPHHHLWAHDGDRYYLDELLADTGSGHNIVATVFVQCGWAYLTEGPPALRPVGETEFVAGVADEATRRGCATRVCAGIVGHADLMLADRVDEVLAAHVAAGGGRFRGIRHITASAEGFRTSVAPSPPRGLMSEPDFRAGFARLGQAGLSFDAWLYHPQIPELTSLARAFPETPIVLNHVGGPIGIGPYAGRRAEAFSEWRAALRDLATCPNVLVKLGGLGMRLGGFGFDEQPVAPSSAQLAAAWTPYVEACIDDFGVARCMFESNFPVDKGMCSYAVLWNAFKRIAQGASAVEKTQLFHDNADRFYRLAA